MLRIPLTSIVIAALLAAHPVVAKNEGNGGGNGGGSGGGNGGGHGNGNGGKDGGNSQGNGNGGGQGQGNSDGSGNSGGNGNSSGNANSDRGGNSGAGGNTGSGGRSDQDSGRSSGAAHGNGGHSNGGHGGGNGKSGGGAEGRGSQGNNIGGGTAGGASSQDNGSTGRAQGGSASVRGIDNREARGVGVQAAPNARASRNVPAATASLPTRASSAELSLPSSLIPRFEPSDAERGGSVDARTPRNGVSGQIVEVCRTSIAAAALRFGAIRVDAAGAGRTSRLPDGGVMAPLQVSIVYARANARQVRQSRVGCRLNAAGSVVALR